MLVDLLNFLLLAEAAAEDHKLAEAEVQAGLSTHQVILLLNPLDYWLPLVAVA
jgi:hypothetical protein